MTDNKLKFLSGGNSMGALMREHDWEQTSLSVPELWPDSLKFAVSISLNSGFPIAIYWGKEFTLLYNDAWSTIPGKKHPWALGKPGEVVWPEIWDGLKDQFESVLNTGESIRRPDALLLMHRYGYTEECYFDYTLSPIVGIDGTIGGVFNAVVETSYRVINDRRNKLIQLFLQNSHQAHHEHEAVAQLMHIMESGKADISFGLLYIGKDTHLNDVSLAGNFGTDETPEPSIWPYAPVEKGQYVTLNNIEYFLQSPVINVWPDPVHEAVIVPISKDDALIKGFMVLGVSPRKKLDTDYLDFLTAVGMHAGTLLNNAFTHEISEAYEREQTLNEELSASNEELSATVDELHRTQETLNLLNNELEQKVYNRTAEVQAAQVRTEKERDRLRRFLMEAPAGIAVLHGDSLVFELVNPLYQQLLPGRELLGRPIGEALREIRNQPVWDILQRVYQTGETFEGNELHVPLSTYEGGPVEDRYFNFIYQARYNESGLVDGISVFCFDVTDTVKSKLLIKESEANFKGLVMTAHYPLMILKGDDMVIEVVNKPIADLWDKNLEDITGSKLLDILPELADQPFLALLKQVYATGVPYGQEEELFYVKNVDGSVTNKYVSFYYDPLISSEGTISGIVVAAADITEIVEAKRRLEESYGAQQTLNEEISAANEELAAANEELQATNEELWLTQEMLEQNVQRLTESEERFKNLIRNATVGIVLLMDEEMRVDVVNDAYSRLVGRTSKELEGARLFELIPEAKADFKPVLEKVRATGESVYLYDQPYFIYHKGQRVDGYLNLIYQPYREKADAVSGVMVLCQDVTEQVIARQKIEASEKRLQFILNAIPQQVWTAEPNGQLNYVNHVVCNDFGYEAEEVVGYGWQKFVHPDDLQSSLKKWEEALKSGSEYLTEFRLLMKTGEYRWHLARALPYLEDGKITLWLGSNTDIELQKLNEQKKDEFLSIASHELKTPLTSIKAFNQLMKRSADPERLGNFIEKSGHHILRLEKLIHDLLDVTKINAGKLTYNMQSFNFGQMLMNSIEGVRHIAPTHEIVLEHAPDITYTGDEYRLEQVMHNFLTNAVKYSPEGKKVIVDCKVSDRDITVSVQDFGIGIAGEHLEKLFDRYYRVDDTAMRFEGLGLGLFISSVIVNRHNGTCWIESEQGKGSTFYFRLPLNN